MAVLNLFSYKQSKPVANDLRMNEKKQAVNMYIYGDQNVNVPDHLHFGKYMLDHLQAAKCNDVCLENGLTREKLTYKEATQFAVNLSAALSKLGVKRGDVVAIGSSTFLHFVPTALAVVLAGATHTSYDNDIGRAVLKHKLDLVKPKYLICSLAFWQSYNDLLKNYDCIETFIAIDDIPDVKLSLKSLASEDVDVESFKPAAVEGETDTALILYSSGTTGMPKGVQISHSSSIFTCLPHAFRKLESLITSYMSFSLSVNFFLFKTFKFLILGRKIVFSPNWSPKIVLGILRDCKVDVIFGTPFYIRTLISNSLPTDDYFDSVKMIYCRSFPLRIETINFFRKRLPKVKDIIQALGLTECGEPMSEICGKYKPGSIGLASPGIVVKVVDPATRAVVGPNQTGEICVKGPTLMKGYLDIERTDYLDKEGFYMTGDLGYYDEEKYFFIIDRLTDIISNRGFKVSPVELENVLLQHPAVLDVGVIGRPAPIVGALPMAFVVKKPGVEVSEKELKDFVAPQVSPRMRLDGGVMFIPEVPRNPRGKTLRRKLIETLNENEAYLPPVPDFSQLRS